MPSGPTMRNGKAANSTTPARAALMARGLPRKNTNPMCARATDGFSARSATLRPAAVSRFS